MHKESHQYIDVVSLMRPITKWNARVTNSGHRARSGAEGLRRGPGRETGRHPLELPEDVMGTDLATVGGEQLGPPGRPSAGPARAGGPGDAAGGRDHPGTGPRSWPWPGTGPCGAGRPVRCGSFVGPRGSRWPRRSWEGAGRRRCARGLGATGLQAGDFEMAGFADADVVVTIGYDLVEQSPAAVESGEGTRRSSASTLFRRRSTPITRRRWSWWGTSTTCCCGLAEECRGRCGPVDRRGSARLPPDCCNGRGRTIVPHAPAAPPG